MKTIESLQSASTEDEKSHSAETLSQEASKHFELTRVSAAEFRGMTPEQKSDFVESAKKQIVSHLRELRKICESNLDNLEKDSEGFRYFQKEIEKIDKQIFRYEDASKVRKLKSISKAEAGLNEAYAEYENKISGFGGLSKKTRSGQKDKRETVVKNNTSDTDVSVGDAPRTEFAGKGDTSVVANEVSDDKSIERSVEDGSIDWSLEPEPESEDSVDPAPAEVEDGEEKIPLARIVPPEERDEQSEESLKTQEERDVLDIATAREQLEAVEEVKDFPITGVPEHSSLNEELTEEYSDDLEAVPDNNSQTKKEIEYIKQEVIKETKELKSLRDEIKSLARGSGWIKTLKVTWELISIFGAVAIDAPWLIDMNAGARFRAENLEKVKDSYRNNWKKLKEKKEKVLALKKELEQAKED